MGGCAAPVETWSPQIGAFAAGELFVGLKTFKHARA